MTTEVKKGAGGYRAGAGRKKEATVRGSTMALRKAIMDAGAIDKGVEVMMEILTDGFGKPADRIRAFESLMKYCARSADAEFDVERMEQDREVLMAALMAK